MRKKTKPVRRPSTVHPTREGRWTRRRAKRMVEHENLMLAWVRLGHALPWDWAEVIARESR